MNKLSTTHDYKLVFRIGRYASKDNIKIWNSFKKTCESGNNKYILERIQDNCKLEQNKNLPLLNRYEGGLGGNNNQIHKQIRFRYYLGETDYREPRDNNIVFKIISTDVETWTYDELDDLIYAFIKTANFVLKDKCVEGCIELTNNNVDSDSDTE